MKNVFAGLCAGLVLAASAQALAYDCEGGACALPERDNQSYCYGSSAYCGDNTEQARDGYGCCRGR